jgi:hypothetical protein
MTLRRTLEDLLDGVLMIFSLLIFWLLIAALFLAASGVFYRALSQTVVDLPGVVVNLPGIGQGWLDTLRAVAGPAAVDTLPTAMQGSLSQGHRYPVGGWYDEVQDVVYINPDTAVYTAFARQITRQGTHQHPLETANPAGVLAHEFGHRFQLKVLLPADGVREPGDTLPDWAQGNPEVFADRFATAMLAIRTPVIVLPKVPGNTTAGGGVEPGVVSDPLQDMLPTILLVLLHRNLPRE